MNDPLDREGSHVLVTSVASGIGAATAQVLDIKDTMGYVVGGPSTPTAA